MIAKWISTARRVWSIGTAIGEALGRGEIFVVIKSMVNIETRDCHEPPVAVFLDPVQAEAWVKEQEKKRGGPSELHVEYLIEPVPFCPKGEGYFN